MHLSARRIFIGLAILAIVQVCWWAYLIVKGHPTLQYMIIAEGMFFISVLLGGIWFAHKSLQRELDLTKSQTDFLSAVTHELKTPLANVRLCLDTLERPNLTDESRRRYLERAQQSIDHLLDEVETILTVSNQSPLQRDSRTSPIKALIESVITSLDQGALKRIDVSIEDANFLAPYHESRLIIRNLIDNAVKYSSSSPDSKIQLLGVKSGPNYKLEVRDQGIGLSSEDINHAFEPFYRGKKSRQLVPSGTGLGLALVKRLADRAGIHIRIENRTDTQGALATVEWTPQRS